MRKARAYYNEHKNPAKNPAKNPMDMYKSDNIISERGDLVTEVSSYFATLKGIIKTKPINLCT
jgi:hypothetical protein